MILGITPARGGSKGVPRKNIKMIAGKPLIAWTIEAAKQSRMLDRYIVSTEDGEIAQVARKFGAEVLARPPQLAIDEASTMSVLQHVIEHIKCDVVVLLQATTPVRKPGLIDECITEFINKGYDSLATGYNCKLVEYGTNELRRQDIPGFFYHDGNIHVIKAEHVRAGNRYGKAVGRKSISRCENVDIDDEFDFYIAEHILNNLQVYCKK